MSKPAKSISKNHNKNHFDAIRQKNPQEEKKHTASSAYLDLCNFDTDGDILGSQHLSNDNINRAHLLLPTSTLSSKPSKQIRTKPRAALQTPP